MKKVTIIEATSRDDITGDRERIRVAAYARVSTEEDEQKNSLAVQREHFERLFADHPEWINAGIYYDEGITGTSMKKRDGFNNLISDAMNGQIDRILVKSISRFARNTVDTLQTIRILKDAGVSVYFEKENMDSMLILVEYPRDRLRPAALILFGSNLLTRLYTRRSSSFGLKSGLSFPWYSVTFSFLALRTAR